MQKKEAGKYLALLSVFLIGCGAAMYLRPKETEPISRSDFLLNTFVTITLYDTEEEEILDSCIQLCREYENRFSKTIPASEVYKMNHRTAEEQSFSLSLDAARLLKTGLYYSELSNGSFDLTIEPLSSLWNFSSGNAVVPARGEIEAAAAKVNYQNLRLEDTTLTFLSPDTTLDFGSIAKGFIADRLKEYLVSRGVKRAIINLGGNVLCVGGRSEDTPFLIGLQMPFDEQNQTFANLEINDCSVVSSGVYERNFEVDGVLYHHLLDPNTGYPYDNGLLSVTIISPYSVDGDALSTACFAMGLEEGLELIDSIDDTYAIFMTEDKEIHYSEGAEALVHE